MDNVALITGVTGQFGSYMSELLLARGYTVIGLHRRASYNNLQNLTECLKNENFTLEMGDLTDSGRIFELIYKYPVTEVYNFGGVSSHGEANNIPQLAMDVNAMGCLKLLEAIRKKDTSIRFFQASSCEIFGSAKTVIQTEDTEINPVNIYGVSKAAAHHLVRMYSKTYGIRGINGILYNSSSPRRDRRFVTRKIADHVASIRRGESPDKLVLNNLDFVHDFSDARSINKAIYLLMTTPYTDSDFILGSGIRCSMRDLCKAAYGIYGLDCSKYIAVSPKVEKQSQIYIANIDKVYYKTGWYYDSSVESMFYSMVEEGVTNG